MNAEEKAAGLFTGGCNCAQSVFGAFADRFGIAADQAAKLSSGLGGGVGRTREICGAVTGATLALGLAFGPGKHEVYPHVQRLCERFRAEVGSTVCRELLAGTGATQGGAPEERTKTYYAKRPCLELVRLAARLCEEELG